MTNGFRVVAVALLLMLPALTSCRWFRKERPVPPPAKIPVRTEPAKPAPPPPLEPPPQIPTATPQAGGLPEPQVEPLPPPEEPAKKRPSPAGPRVAGPAEPPAAPPTAPSPQLRPMLTPAQRQELERSVNERIRRAKITLDLTRGRSLTREQTDLVAQIRTFVRQAEEASTTDLLRANNLAERAEVLAQDLSRRLR